MYTNHLRGNQQPSKTGQDQSRSQPVASRQSLGRSTGHASKVGAGEAQAQPPRPESATANPDGRPVGGQADLRFFGVPSDFRPTNRGDQGQYESRALASGGKASPPQAPRCDTARRVNGQTFSQRRARFAGFVAQGAVNAASRSAPISAPRRVVPAKAQASTRGDVIPPASKLPVKVGPITLKTFERMAERHGQTVGEFLAAKLACWAKKIVAEESAMLENAIAADLRERFVAEPLDEWTRPALYGHVEIELAMVG